MRLQDANGNPSPGVELEFRVEEGGGSVSPEEVVTDREGRATPSEWVLGETAGTNVLVADLGELGEERFEVDGQPGPPAQLEQTSSPDKRGQVGHAVDDPPAVQATDEFGNPVPDVTVEFEPADGHGSIQGSPADTDGDGVARTSAWQLGTTAGEQSLEASVEEPADAPASSLTITAQAEPGPPSRFEAADSETPEGEVATSVPDVPAARVLDSFENPVPGVAVTFEPRPEAGAIEGSPADTDDEGVARAEAWELGTAAGLQQAEASIAQGEGEDLDPYVLEVRALAGPPEASEAASTTSQDGTPGEPVAEVPTLRVEDAYGNPVPDVEVAFEVVEGGGEVAGSPVDTDEEGLASPESWTLGPDPGTNRVVASVEGLEDVQFEAEAAERQPDRLVELSDPDQEVEVGAEVPDPPAVRVVDEEDVPVPGVSVAFEPGAEHGAVEGSPATSDAEGVARVEGWTLGTTAGTQSVEASVVDEPEAQVDPLELSVTAVAGPPDVLDPEAPTSQDGRAEAPVGEPPAVRVLDQYENPVPDVSVDFQVVEGGGNVAGSPATSDGAGLAEVESWTLGPDPGLNRVEASVGTSGVSSVVFEADAAEPEGELLVRAVHLNQASQDLHGTIGGVAGRPGRLRVIVEAEESNTWTPDVQVRLSVGGNVFLEETIPAPSGSVPTDPDLADPDDTWDLELPASDVPEGLEVEAIVDPDSTIAQEDRDGFRFPVGGGTASLDVEPLAPLNVELFPIHWESEDLTGEIHSGNVDEFMADTERWIPLPDRSAEIRNPFSTDEDLSTVNGWVELLGDLQALRDAEGAQDEYYHGIVPDFEGIPLGGIAYVASSPSSPYRTGLTYDRFPFAPGTLAHELGHNMGLGHAPCPGTSPSGVDGDFPYDDGSIGVPGYDVLDGELVDPSSHSDYMSYCRPRWTSDYMYNELVEWRRDDPHGDASSTAAAASPGGTGASFAGGTEASAAGGQEGGLLLWGRAGPEGVHLNPGFSLESRPSLPQEDGPMELRAVSADGSVVFQFSFDGVPASEPPGSEARHFSFFVPVAEGDLEALERIELSTPWGDATREAASMARGPADPDRPEPSVQTQEVGPEGIRVSWDTSLAPAVMVRDQRTGQVLGIGRSGQLNLLARELARGDAEVLVSDGVRSRRWD